MYLKNTLIGAMKLNAESENFPVREPCLSNALQCEKNVNLVLQNVTDCVTFVLQGKRGVYIWVSQKVMLSIYV